MIEITAYKNRRCVFDVQLFDHDGAPITPDTGDRVVVAIGKAGGTPLLLLDSAAPTANGSTLVINGDTSRITIKSSDLATLAPAVWDLELAFVDASQGPERFTAEQGTFTLRDTQTVS